MLGFDAYTKSTIGTIVKQRIALFLVKRAVINYPILLKQAKSKQGRQTITKKFFDKFVVELNKQGRYEEYAFASIFIEDPDYDFLSNDTATSIRKARKSLKQQFEEVSSDYFDEIAGEVLKGEKSTASSAADDDVFGFLAEPQFQREIPRYAEIYNLWYSMPDGLRSDYKSFRSSFLVPTDGKTINEIKSPFYAEYFYRLKTSSPPRAGAQREYYNYFSRDDKIIATSIPPSAKPAPEGSAAAFSNIAVFDPNDPVEEFNKNFDRGIRLMFNLSAGIDLKKDDKGFVYLEPTNVLPFFEGEEDVYTDLYPLPFLSDFSLPEKSHYHPNFWSALWLTLRDTGAKTFQPTKEKRYLEGSFDNTSGYIDKDGQSATSFKPNFYTSLASIYWSSIYPKGEHLQVPTPDNQAKFSPPLLQWSKSLVSLEIASETKPGGAYPLGEPCYAYFPMIVGEFVDETGQLDDPQLLEKLLETDTVAYLKSLIPKSPKSPESSGDQFKDLKKQLVANEENLNTLSWVQPTLGNPFNTKEEEKGLDNMLINLINFDEE